MRKKKKQKTFKRYRDRRGRFSKLDRRKKLRVEIAFKRTGRILKVQKRILKPKKRIPLKPRPKRALKELVFCVSDLPQEILELWEKTPGFEFFDRLNNLKLDREYRMYLMLSIKRALYRGIYKKNMTYQIGEHHKTNVFTVYQFQEWCSGIVEEAISNASEYWFTETAGDMASGDVSVDYVFAYNPDKVKLPREEYEKRWKKEEEARQPKYKR